MIIPIVVLEELDKFKRGNDIINFHAREFTRELDKLSGDMLLTANIPLGENLGNLHIETGRDFSEKVSQSFPERTADHRILAIAEYVCNANKNKNCCPDNQGYKPPNESQIAWDHRAGL